MHFWEKIIAKRQLLLRVTLNLVVFTIASNAAQAQPGGLNYVMQPDFGDSQFTAYPGTTGEWLYLNWWENIQTSGVATDWFGPNYMPLGNAARLHYIMLDDDNNDYGAVAGRIRDLEYRQVRCNFAYHIYNENNPAESVGNGTLYVVLAGSENDIRAFDPDQPNQFVADGFGQVLFRFDFPFSPPTRIIDPWPELSTSGQFSEVERTNYALGLSPSGTPGSPFQYVGLVWVSLDHDARICIDDFYLRDWCPNCVIVPRTTELNGCFDNTWRTPIRSNYYYYSVTIKDSATNDLIFEEIHQPARFIWDGFGNQGTYDGVQIPYGTVLKANVKFYSCLLQTANFLSQDYILTRTQGCTDTTFGSGKTQAIPDPMEIYPNPSANGESTYLVFRQGIPPNPMLRVIDAQGRVALHAPLSKISNFKSGDTAELNLSNLGSGIYLLSVYDKDFAQTIVIRIADQ